MDNVIAVKFDEKVYQFDSPITLGELRKKLVKYGTITDLKTGYFYIDDEYDLKFGRKYIFEESHKIKQ